MTKKSSDHQEEIEVAMNHIWVASGEEAVFDFNYRALFSDLGWVDFNFQVTSSCPHQRPILPNF